LRRYGEERPTRAGQVLFREGDRAYDFIVVLSGSVAVVDHEAGAERELVTLGPGAGWAGRQARRPTRAVCGEIQGSGSVGGG
jgi:hypothetical protein